MQLLPGARLGTYEIVTSLGAGGMGEVYRARDTRLKRDVALKILKGPWASDPDRLKRFQREAEMLAALNHPNIAAIYGIDEFEGSPALILELVEGPTLADRIARGPVPTPEASASRVVDRSMPRTRTGSSIGTSSPPTSRSGRMAPSRFSISVSRGRSNQVHTSMSRSRLR